MSHIDPATWTQLIIAAATLFTAIAGWLRSNSNSHKLDKNTDLTKDIHAVTNGPLSAMGQNVTALAVQAASNAAEARSTAEAAKIQAAVDAKTDSAPAPVQVVNPQSSPIPVTTQEKPK